MSIGWAIQIDLSHARSVASLRTQPAIEVHVDDQSIWLRGPGDISEANRSTGIAALPANGRFNVDPDGRLRHPGKAVPVGSIPRKDWQPIDQWVYVDAPAAAIPGRLPQPLRISLAPANTMAEANLLLCSLDDFAHYAMQAAKIRLDALVFAASHSGTVVVAGQPLPSIRGSRFSSIDNVATPLGWKTSPEVSSKVLHDCANADMDDLLILLPDQSWQIIKADSFVRATRSAIRQTAEHVASRSAS